MDVLTDAELRRLIRAAEATGPKDDDTVVRICSWAERVRVESALLDLALSGEAIIEWDFAQSTARFRLKPGSRRWADA